MINEFCLIRNTQEVTGCQFNYVLRIAHFSINNGENLSQIIISAPSLQELLQLHHT